MGKKIISIVLITFMCLALVACGGASQKADYNDDKSFEAALNNGENVEGKIVSFEAVEVVPDSAMGYNIWGGEHLNFVPRESVDAKVGETITLRVIAVEKYNNVSWLIDCTTDLTGTLPSSRADELLTLLTNYYNKPSEPIETTEPETEQEVYKYLGDIFLPDNMRFGMATAEIEDTETRPKNTLYTIHNYQNSGVDYLAYNGKLKEYYELDTGITYYVKDNKLIAYECEYDKDSPRIESYLDLYDDIKEELTGRYGECMSEEIIWTDETYKDDPSMQEKAFQYGYVTINSRWEADGKVIIVNWDYQDSLYVITTTPESEYLL